MVLHVIQQWYKPTNGERAREINKVFEMNSKNEFIKFCPVLERQEHEEDFRNLFNWNDKLDVIEGRATYYNLLKWACDNVPLGEYVAIANSDIIFEFNTPWDMLEEYTPQCLSRWELKPDLDFDSADFSYSVIVGQATDAWIMKVDERFIEFTNKMKKYENVVLGTYGCDWVVCLGMWLHWGKIFNFIQKYRIYHLHNVEGVRSWGVDDDLYIDWAIWVFGEGICLAKVHNKEKKYRIKFLKETGDFNRKLLSILACGTELHNRNLSLDYAQKCVDALGIDKCCPQDDNLYNEFLGEFIF